MSLSQRIAYRNSLPHVSIWEFSSSSDEEKPCKKPKIEEPEVEAPARVESPESDQLEYGPTMKIDIKPANPKLLEQLGYVNRNSRPPNSRKNQILSSLDLKKPDISACIQERRMKEQAKISQIRQLLEHQKP